MLAGLAVRRLVLACAITAATGCGSSSPMSEIIDAGTGRDVELPITCPAPPNTSPPPPIDYRNEMAKFVSRISRYAKCKKEGFGIFSQNGAALGSVASFMEAVDGIAQEDIYYGYEEDGVATPSDVTTAMEQDLDVFLGEDKLVLTVDYVFDDPSTPSYDLVTVTRINDAWDQSEDKGYVPTVAVRDLSAYVVAPAHSPGSNGDPLSSFDQVTSWGYRLQPSDGQSRADYVDEQGSEDFDIIVMDYSYDGSGATPLNENEIDSIRNATGGFVLAYISIGEAESYRYYWTDAWAPGNPDFVGEENPDWPGNYKVRYWDPDWQKTIFGSSQAYVDRILDAGFDGVYLDVVDAYECYEAGDCIP